jgi:hypothetical protein
MHLPLLAGNIVVVLLLLPVDVHLLLIAPLAHLWAIRHATIGHLSGSEAGHC